MIAAVACGAGALGAAGARAGVVYLPAAHDNTMYEDFGADLSNGAGPSIFAGLTQFESRRRGLISFDVSSVPAGSTITSVSLTLHCTRSASLGEPVSLHPALAAWGEGPSIALGEGGNGTAAMPGDATWRYQFYPTTLWAVEGGVFGAASAVTDVVADGAYAWSSPAMVADVQAWLDAPATNFGWMVRGNEGLPQTAKRFASREHEDGLLRPVLVVEYVPSPGGVVVVGTWGAVAARRRRRG